MSEIVGGVVVLVITLSVLILGLNYEKSQNLRCPYCDLEFTSDIYFIGKSTVRSCPFCHRWMIVTRMGDRNIVRRLFEAQGPKTGEFST
jgi:hypothetical protein